VLGSVRGRLCLCKQLLASRIEDVLESNSIFPTVDDAVEAFARLPVQRR
jgi:hypothetical protein